MKTLDGYNLKKGERCFVSIQSLEGNKSISSNPRPAVYIGEDELDFKLLRARFENQETEVISVWKNKP